MLFKKENKQAQSTADKVAERHAEIVDKQREIEELQADTQAIKERTLDTTLSTSEIVDLNRQIMENEATIKTLNNRLPLLMMNTTQARETLTKIKHEETLASQEAYNEAMVAMKTFYDKAYQYKEIALSDEQRVRSIAKSVNGITVQTSDDRLNAYDILPNILLPGIWFTAQQLKQNHDF